MHLFTDTEFVFGRSPKICDPSARNVIKGYRMTLGPHLLLFDPDRAPKTSPQF